MRLMLESVKSARKVGIRTRIKSRALIALSARLAFSQLAKGLPCAKLVLLEEQARVANCVPEALIVELQTTQAIANLVRWGFTITSRSRQYVCRAFLVAIRIWRIVLLANYARQDGFNRRWKRVLVTKLERMKLLRLGLRHQGKY